MIDWKIVQFDMVDSTNSKALEMAEHGAAEGTIIVANSQTAGRGRLGRTWHSPGGEGLFFSTVLYPPFRDNRLFVLPILAGCAVAAAIKGLTGLSPLLKWPNDVLINGKKVCGILVENKFVKKRLAAILGIGMNVNNTNFPEEISQAATSIRVECKKEIPFPAVLRKCLSELSRRYEDFISGKNESIIDEARKSSALAGKQVRIVTENGEFRATAVDLDETGALIVKLKSGETQTFTTGEVQLVREATNEHDS